ncbi:hypothetical protein ACQ4PT_027314 [Festuca glaucescens]
MWEFSVGLYMIRIWPDSLLLAAIYGVVESSSVAVFGPMVGTLVHRLTYLQVLGLWLVVQCLSFIIAGASVTALLVLHNLKDTRFPVFVVLVVVTNVSGALAALSSLAGTILIEREWVVVICRGHPEAVLTKINSVIRRIDLSCKLLAPVLSGLVISFVSTQASAVALALWNAASVGLQYWLFVSVYKGVPALGENVQLRREAAAAAVLPSSELVAPKDEEAQKHGQEDGSGWRVHVKKQLSNLLCLGSWAVYMRQELWYPDDGSSGLERHPRLRDQSGSGIQRHRRDRCNLAVPDSALVGVHAPNRALWCFLLMCVGSIWVSGRVASAWVLMAGVAASRLGLWMFDLAVTQLMQDNVLDPDRCVVGGVQNSLQSIFDLLTYIMGIIISDPRDFSELIVMSFFLVSCAALVYTLHVYRVRKHLFHLDKIIPNMGR